MPLNSSMIAAGLLATMMVSSPVMAHHSYAMFDNSKEIVLTGTVQEFDYSGPHAWVYLVVADNQGQAVKWSLECRSPEELARQGLRSVDIKPGDKLSATVYAARNGSKYGAVIRVDTANGKHFGHSHEEAQKGT